MSDQPIRILIADDHAIVRKGLRALLEAKPGVTVIGEAADGMQAVSQARRLRPDVILLDLIMPRKDGIAAIHEIMSDNPEARILVLSSFGEDDKVFAAIKGGAMGYLLKDSSPQALLAAIRDIHAGQPSIQPSIALRMVRELNQQPAQVSHADVPLSDRELEVLRLIAKGLTNQDIAARMTISLRTVTTHVSNVLGKLHLANRTQAALYALREGFADLD